MSQTLQDKIKLKIDEMLPHLNKALKLKLYKRSEIGRSTTYRENGVEYEIMLKISARDVE